ncbi:MULTISPECIES: alpha-galactosidase [unclassified Crossiella]|uniref:alpha-galactosidase n=1 Tax=unclassified Crossiella TaxID=2620835 RepID=UPI001FFFAE3F|nr:MULTISPECIES: alpha-galactosidase [unclassified Crossiella]MCK2241667.1 alpha-galactosidase [Crossiella sp. S99.2]MCK2255461.1 alpha-galactosidase [Crossiella sp. S99.1]
MTNWTLRLATTSYTVALAPDGRWAELHSWGPHGIEDGPSPLRNNGEVHFITEADAAPIEYAPRGLRAFGGADLEVAGETWWSLVESESTSDTLRLTFADELSGLWAELCYQAVPGQDVLLRWVEFTNTGPADLELSRLDSAGVCIPTGSAGARLTYLTGQWSQEFQRRELILPAGRFGLHSRFGVPGHAAVPWLAVQDAAEPDGPAWGISLAWSGSWQLEAEIEPAGWTRVHAGRLPHPGPIRLAPGQRLSTPELALASSVDGLDGLSRVWHAYDRSLSRPRARPVLYNSWEATGFDVDGPGQLALAKVAADLGVELFVVDDGWFTGRHDDTGGLGDWTPDESAFLEGFGAFVQQIRALGLDFGLWVEPESVSPKSKLYAEHPDWVYRIDGRPATLIRNQLLLDLGREDVYLFLRDTLGKLLDDYPISYLKWDMNRPPTERGGPAGDLDAAHVANYHRLLDHLRTTYPHVTIEACAGGGARTDLATIARTDVLWPSDNTGPLDRLSIQDGFLLAHAPHLLSSWVTDAPGIFDPRPRSLKFRFVTAMAGVLGIGADLGKWSAGQRAEATELIAQYKKIRGIIHTGVVHRPRADRDTEAVQYTAGDTVVVLAWNTGRLDGAPLVPGRSARVRLRGLNPAASYVDRTTGARYSGAHLLYAGLPFDWTPADDAAVTVLDTHQRREVTLP